MVVVLATTLAVGLTWSIDLIGGLVAPFAPNFVTGVTRDTNPLAFQVLTSVTGATTGLIIGIMQWGAMAGSFRRASPWIWVNTAAWAVTMPLFAAGLKVVPGDGSALVTLIELLLVCGSAGLVAGGITGIALVRLAAAQTAGSHTGSPERLAA